MTPSDVVIYLGGGRGATAGKVTGLLGQPLPGPNVGYIYYNGTAWSFQLGTPSVNPGNPPASWLVADWYVNPATGNDSNAGTSAGTAVQTVMGGIVSKWGTASPTIKQNTTIHLLAAETLSQEDVRIDPVVVEGAWFAIVGTPILVASFQLGVVTSKNRATATPLSSTGFVAAGIAVGCLVVNTDRGNSESMIQNLAGGTATLSQPLGPLTPAVNAANFVSPGFTPEVDTWAHNDHVSVYALPLLNLKLLQVSGGDSTPATLGGVSWVQYVSIPDVAGAGNSYYSAGESQGCINYYVSCRIDPYVTFTGTQGGGTQGGFVVGCAFNGGSTVADASVIGGYVNLYALALAPGGCVDGDCLCASGLRGFDGISFIGLAYVGSGLLVFNGATSKIDPIYYPTATLWGTGGCDVEDNSTLMNKTGDLWANVLLLGLALDGQATGTKYVAGVWTDGVTVNVANLDLFTGLQNPRTGARYCLPA